MEKDKDWKNKHKNKTYLKWTKEMDCILTNVLLDQHNLGNQVPYGRKPVAYTAAVNAMKEQCNVLITKENIGSQLKTWDKYYAVITNMLATSGFGWDWDHHMVKVDSEEVWENYVKSHPEVSSYKCKEVENWENLATICGQDRALGDGAETGVEAMNTFASLPRKRNATMDIIKDSIDLDDIPNPIPNLGKKPTSALNTNVQRKRSRSDDPLALAITHMDDTINKGYSTELPKSSPGEILGELSLILDLDESIFVQAYDIVADNERKFQSFKAFPTIHLKKIWIMKQVEKSNR